MVDEACAHGASVSPVAGFDGCVLGAEVRCRHLCRDQPVFGFPDEFGDAADRGRQWQPDVAGLLLEDQHGLDELAGRGPAG